MGGCVSAASHKKVASWPSKGKRRSNNGSVSYLLYLAGYSLRVFIYYSWISTSLRGICSMTCPLGCLRMVLPPEGALDGAGSWVWKWCLRSMELENFSFRNLWLRFLLPGETPRSSPKTENPRYSYNFTRLTQRYFLSTWHMIFKMRLNPKITMISTEIIPGETPFS